MESHPAGLHADTASVGPHWRAAFRLRPVSGDVRAERLFGAPSQAARRGAEQIAEAEEGVRVSRVRKGVCQSTVSGGAQCGAHGGQAVRLSAVRQGVRSQVNAEVAQVWKE